MWKTVKLSEICEIQPPKKEVKNILEDDSEVSFMGMDLLGIDKMHANPEEVRSLSSVYKGYTYFAENDVLLAKITPCFENGKLGVARGLNNGVGFGSSEFVVFRCTENILPNFLYYFLNQKSFREEGKKNMSGAVGHKRVTKEFIANSLISYPPLAEQQRIVAKLDAAFVEIERKFLQTNFDEKNFDAKDVYSLEQVATFNSGNTPSKKNPDFWNGDFPWISAKDLKFEEIRESIDKITQNAVNCGAAKIAGKGSLLILVRGMGLLNGIAIGELQRDCAFNQDIKALVPKPSLNSRFLLLLLKARFLNLDSYLTSAAHGTAKVEFERIKKTRVVVPPLPQQLELVERHKGLVKQCQKSLGTAESTVRELSALKSAILAQELQSEAA